MTSQPSKPMSAEQAIEYFEWRLSLYVKEPEIQECYRMAIEALRRPKESDVDEAGPGNRRGFFRARPPGHFR
jgi:hypothetical protein